jgi:phosphoglycerate dehydrogenase-like enzyme
MRYIAVFDHFLTEAHRRQVNETAGKCGFSVVYCRRIDGLTPEDLTRCEVLYGDPQPDEIPRFPNLKWVCISSAGFNRYVDEAIYPTPDVILSNSSGAYGLAISEHILTVALMLLRQMPLYMASASRHHWQEAVPVRSLSGSRITVLGTGDIGTSFARRAKALGASHITGVRRTLRPADPAFDAVTTFEGLNAALPHTDILVSALPHTPETTGVLSRERISLLPSEAILINVGRGSAVDQDALLDALNTGRLAGAALDVMVPEPLPEDHPLWSAPNLIITPHMSGNMSLGQTCDIDVDMFCSDLERFSAGERPLHAVDRRRGY